MLRFLERERIFPFDRPRENFVLSKVLIDGMHTVWELEQARQSISKGIDSAPKYLFA